MSEYEAERRKKRDELREAGLYVYGRRTEDILPVNALPSAGEGDEGPEVKVAGRIVLKRDMGKLSFLTIRDSTGDVQIGLQKNRLSEDGWLVRNALDLGDLIVAEGKLGVTKTGQPTVWAESVSMAAKSLVVPPDKHKGLEDQELRYRQRYVDLWANPESMEVMQKRFAIIDAMRKYLRDKGFMEVETPMLQPIHGGAAARPFETHHNAYDIPLYLRIAPELYLKRLLVGGMPKVFEINRNFRNEGVSPRHNPEFTMLEAYEAYGNWETMAQLVEDMICTVAMEVLGTTVITIGEKEVDLGKRPWRRVSLVELVEEASGWDYDHTVEERSLLQDWERDQMILHLAKRSGREPRWDDVTQHVESDERRSEIRNCLAEFYEASAYWQTCLELRSWVEAAALRAMQQVHQVVEETLGTFEVKDWEQARDSVQEEQTEVRALARQAHSDLVRFESELGEFSKHLQAAREIVTSVTAPSLAGQLVQIYEKVVEPTLIEPTFVTRVPSSIIPLARPCEDDPYFADVYELVIGGQEISPGYTELNDPDVQAQLFADQAVEDEGERQKVDHDFLHALKVGMPPAGGMGLGVDRLVMLLLGQPSIRDVLAFPLMKPQS